LFFLAQDLSAVAARMDPREAAATLAQALKDTKDPRALHSLAQGLSAVANRMDAKEAADATALAAATVFRSVASAADPTRLKILGVYAGIRDRVSRPRLSQFASDPTARGISAQFLAALLSTVSPAEVSRRVASVACVGTGHPLTALPFLVAAAEPLPCRLSTQQLVELLKYPSCVGAARRVVLNYLGHRYQHRFADLWEFVDYAHEHLPGLDLTTPPKRLPRYGGCGGGGGGGRPN
jgi:hypothetical protein